MDRRRMTPWEKEERKTESLYKEKRYSKYKEYNFPDSNSITWREVPKFKSIKECYEKDRCFAKRNTMSPTDSSYDDYKRLLGIWHIEGIGGWRPSDHGPVVCKREPIIKNCTGPESFGIGRIPYRHFTRSYHSKKKDMINFYDGELNVYTAGLEVVRLKDGKNLIAVRIIEFRPMNPEKEGYVLASPYTYTPEISGLGRGNIAKENMRYRFSLSSAFTLWDIREDDIEEMSDSLAISLDKRENPTKIYINTGKKIYEIPIPKKEKD